MEKGKEKSTVIDSLVSLVSAKKKASQQGRTNKKAWKLNQQYFFQRINPIAHMLQLTTTDKVPSCTFPVIFPFKTTEHVRIRGVIDVGSKPISS